MRRIELKFPEKAQTYNILIGEKILDNLGAEIAALGLRGRVVVVTNVTIAPLYLEKALQSLRSADFLVDSLVLPDGEIYKNSIELQKVYNFLVDGNYDRKTILVALGGGVIGDLTGFAAATYMRGIPFVQVPTTLLAQVDSSIGGKVAVNHECGKNLIGAFYQPRLVLSDVNTLKTLPLRELLSGIAEILKHGIIADEDYFNKVSENILKITAIDADFMTEVVWRSCEIKAAVVSADEKETGYRAVLNFGHTIGHALEALTGYTVYKHGEGVLLGMSAALKIAEKSGMLADDSIYRKLQEVMTALNAPMRIVNLASDDIYRALYSDKKTEYGKIRWIMPEALGKVIITEEVSQDTVKMILKEMGAE